jgi:hypothetical protein
LKEIKKAESMEWSLAFWLESHLGRQMVCLKEIQLGRRLDHCLVAHSVLTLGQSLEQPWGQKMAYLMAALLVLEWEAELGLLMVLEWELV